MNKCNVLAQIAATSGNRKLLSRKPVRVAISDLTARGEYEQEFAEMLKLLTMVLLLVATMQSQALPDAPSKEVMPNAGSISSEYISALTGEHRAATSADRNPLELRESQRKCGPWRCYQLSTIPTHDVFKSKAFWATWMGDVAISSFDAEMTHAGIAHHHCQELNVNPPNPSRWDLYRNNLPENAAAGVVSFVWVKVKGPKWIMPAFLTGPVVGHVFQGGLTWYENCW